MTKLILIASLIVGIHLFQLGYFDDLLDDKTESTCEKPDGFPEWIDWNCEAQAAYENGTLYINEDTTAIAYTTKREIHSNATTKIPL